MNRYQIVKHVTASRELFYIMYQSKWWRRWKYLRYSESKSFIMTFATLQEAEDHMKSLC